MSNENCLEGMCCPKCGSFEPFNIEVTKIVTVFDSGTEDSKYGDTEWTDESYADCLSCDWTGTVNDLYVSR